MAAFELGMYDVRATASSGNEDLDDVAACRYSRPHDVVPCTWTLDWPPQPCAQPWYDNELFSCIQV